MAPIVFRPIYMERIWGGRRLEKRYGRTLPLPNIPYGEAWDIVDREDSQSIVESGAYRGKSLHDLWSFHREEIFGSGISHSDRFPILIKTLDCSDDLSLQVHPPAAVAAKLGGEPKTEMWYIADHTPGAKLYVGLKAGVDKASFEQSIADGTVADQVHIVTPEKGQSIFIESGRLHAIGAGFVIHEIQQNSDTTYRVFDWNRKDSNGNMRQLHTLQSLDCIDFHDHEPQMDVPKGDILASCPFFKTSLHHLKPGKRLRDELPDRFSLITVVEGGLDGGFTRGQTLLLPRGSASPTAIQNTSLLLTTIP